METRPIPSGDVYVSDGNLVNRHPWGTLILFNPTAGTAPGPVNKTTVTTEHCAPAPAPMCWRCCQPAAGRFCPPCRELTAAHVPLQAPGPSSGCIWCGVPTPGLACAGCDLQPAQDLVATTF